MSASGVSKPIFYINATEYKNNISTLMLSGSGKNFVSFGSISVSASPRFAAYSRKSGSGCFKFGSSKEGIEFETFSQIKTENVSVE